MALAINPEFEQRAIITILNSTVLGPKLLGQVGVEHFGEDSAQEVVTRVLKRLQAGKDTPSREIMIGYSGLSEQARQYLTNIELKPIKKESDLEHLIEGLNFHRKVRAVLRVLSEVKEACRSATQENVNELESKIDQLTLDMKGGSNAPKIANFGSGDTAVSDSIIQKITSNNKGDFVPTGFDYFDSRAGGFRKSNAVLIAGPTGGGKSALANQLLLNMYLKANLKVLMCSFEMNDVECTGRMVASCAGIDHTKIERRELSTNDATEIVKWKEEFDQHGKANDCWFKLWNPEESLTAANLVSYARPLAPDVMVVDYVGLLGQDDPREEQWRALGDAMRQFKMAAAKLKCCIIVLAQFDQTAMVVKYSRALREHANVMWSYIYGPQEQATGIVTICQMEPMGKNRNCQPFNFRLKYELKFMRIVDGGPSDDVAVQPKNAKVKPDNAVKKLPVARTTPGLVDDD